MADGHVLVEVNSLGEGRVFTMDEAPYVTVYDLQLSCCDFDADFLAEEMVGQLPSVTTKDALVLCTFTYKSIECGGYESTEYEDSFHLDSFTVVQNNYKEFYRKQVTDELALEGTAPDCEDSEYYKNIVGHWEEFYNEDFKPTDSKRKEIKYGF